MIKFHFLDETLIEVEDTDMLHCSVEELKTITSRVIVYKANKTLIINMSLVTYIEMILQK